MSSPKDAFEQAVWDDIMCVMRRGYTPTYFVEMVNTYGCIEAAHRLLAQEEPSAGLMRLYHMGLLGRSLEALIWKTEYDTLFSAEERATALRKLHALNYHPPWATGSDDAP